MRIQILPKAGLLEPATQFSCDNHRVVMHNIVSTIAFWSNSGAKLAQRDASLTDDQYLAWCELSADDPDDPFFLAAHMETLGLEAVPPPPPPPPPVPETDEERVIREANEKAAQIAELTQRITDLSQSVIDAQVQLALLQSN